MMKKCLSENRVVPKVQN